MTSQVFAATPASPYRSAGWAAITSGAIGTIAFVCLITAVTTRTSMALSRSVNFFFRAHDAGLIFQFLLLTPVAVGLHMLSGQRAPGLSRATRNVGIGALAMTVLILLLVFPKILNDDYYLVPQGVFGVWLIVVCWRLQGIIAGRLRWLGMIVGLGLVMVGVYALGEAILVDPTIFYIPAIPPTTDHDTPANHILYQLILVGTIHGRCAAAVLVNLPGKGIAPEVSVFESNLSQNTEHSPEGSRPWRSKLPSRQLSSEAAASARTCVEAKKAANQGAEFRSARGLGAKLRNQSGRSHSLWLRPSFNSSRFTCNP